MKLVQIGTVDVDAGVVMIGDPCYTLPDDASRRSGAAKEWARFCEVTGDAIHSEPFGPGAATVVRTLHGDGEYPVMAELTSDGRISRLVLDLDPDADCQADYEEDDWNDD